MTVTYSQIASITADGNASDYEFTSIPNTYTDLVLVVMARGANTSTDVLVQTYINFDFGSNYSATLLEGTGSAAQSSRVTNQAGMPLGTIPAASSTSGVFGTIIANYQNYANTTTNKTVLSRSSQTVSYVQARAGLYRSTSAITRIGVATYGTGNFVSGSTFSLYGIKAE